MLQNKCRLKSHMDGIRGLQFIPQMNTLVSASEDCTIKVWDANKFISLKDIDIQANYEPYLTLRGHLDPVMSLSSRHNCSSM